MPPRVEFDILLPKLVVDGIVGISVGTAEVGMETVGADGNDTDGTGADGIVGTFTVGAWFEILLTEDSPFVFTIGVDSPVCTSTLAFTVDSGEKPVVDTEGVGGADF